MGEKWVAAQTSDDAFQLGVAWGAQLANIRLLLARGAPGDADRADRLLGELIASLGLARGARRTDAPTAAAAAPLRFQFRREGDYWTIAAGAKVSRVRSLRGLEYIAELIRHPHESIYVVDLAAPGVRGEAQLSIDDAVDHGLRISAEPGVVPMLDRRARETYRARWQELLAEEAEARHDNDAGRADRAQREIAMLAAELSASAGGQGGRSGASFRERARINVRNCIAGALRAVRPHDAVLWRHLTNSIKTGSFCCYDPDRDVEWDM
jgi:hypothetical protein